MKIAFVCMSNVCRSPMAEGIFKNLIKTNEYSQPIYCMSMGLVKPHYKKIDNMAIKVCKEIGIDISYCKPKSIASLSDTSIFDLFAVMNETYGYILHQAGIPIDKIYVLKKNVPYLDSKDINDYRKLRDILVESVNIFYKYVQSKFLLKRII